MSNKSTAVSGLVSACNMFKQDLEALPEEAFTKRFGPKVRTVADIVYEVNMVNDMLGMIIRGEEPPAWPEGGWVTAPGDFNTKDIVLAAFSESSAKIIATAEALTPEELLAPMQSERGETNREERCRFLALHRWYHSGQLNYIQTLFGDDEWHWK
jgi:hypothetical protein